MKGRMKPILLEEEMVNSTFQFFSLEKRVGYIQDALAGAVRSLAPLRIYWNMNREKEAPSLI